jgi:hypothetical protein
VVTGVLIKPIDEEKGSGIVREELDEARKGSPELKLRERVS